MRVLAIAPQPFFTARGTPFSVYYRTLVMAEQGAQVDLLTYGAGQDVEIPGVRIIRIPGPGPLGRNIPIGPSVKKAVLDVLMVLWTVGLLMRRRYDLVHAHEEAVFWCRPLKWLFRFRLIYDMHSSLPQQLSNFNYSRSKLLSGAFRRAEDAALHAADAVITICPDLAHHVTRQGVEARRHFLIENSIFDPVRLKQNGHHNGSAVSNGSMGSNGAGDPDPLQDLEMRDGEAGLRIVYTGTFEHYQGIDLLIRAMPHVLAERPDARLITVGGTASQVDSMRRLAEELGAAHACTFMGMLPKDRTRRYVEAADVLVSPRRRGTNTPLKVYEWLASGIPVVATRIWSHTQVLNGEVSVLVDPEPEHIAGGVLTIARDPARAARLTEAARSLYERRYSRAVYEQKVRDLLGAVS